MFGLRKILFVSSILLSTFASPTHQHDEEVSNWDRFSALLDTVDDIALHRVLHALSPKFKDGVFSKDRTAIEHVHSEDPIMASKLVNIAKRQASNSTTTNVSASTTTSISSEQSSSLSASISSALSSALASDITATTVPSPTTIFIAPTTPASATPVASQSDYVVYSTYGGGVVTLTSSAVNVAFTPSTSTRLYYSTMSDGNIHTSTAVVIVNAPVTKTANPTGAAAAATTSGTGLQSSSTKTTTDTFVALLSSIFAALVVL